MKSEECIMDAFKLDIFKFTFDSDEELVKLINCIINHNKENNENRKLELVLRISPPDESHSLS